MSLLHQLSGSKRLLLNVELCPPRIDLPIEQSVDAWIDSNRLIRKITSLGRFVFMTDGAIGKREEPNLRHVTLNLGPQTDRAQIVPILTTKHSLEYCLEFAERAFELGFTSLVVLGGDKSDGEPRCVEHAHELRRLIRKRVPEITLGGWTNPHGGMRQIEYMLDPDYSADFYLAQIVSHYQTRQVDDFLNTSAKKGVKIPGIFGVFYYRSANAKTLEMLSPFFPVPVEELKAGFQSGLTPIDMTVESIRSLLDRGVSNIYISNLPLDTGGQKLMQIEEKLERGNSAAPEKV
jgi:5,10-methylenetetrahydrofolate reductase